MCQYTVTSISVWQNVKLSEQIRPLDALACCWDVKQPTNIPHSVTGSESWFDLLFLSVWRHVTLS